MPHDEAHAMDEKKEVEGDVSLEISSVEDNDASKGDEALRLVGKQRSAEFSEEYYQKLKRRLDWVIPPLCSAVYFTQYLDKNTLNYASIMGLPITGQHYNLVAMAFYLGYLTWEFPTVYISQKLRAGKYLGANIVLWGAVLMLHAATTSFGVFFFLRFILGMLESCVAPILILIISMFYKKEEQGLRIAWFYVMNGLTAIFGGFVAYGITYYTGTHFLPYRILYLLIGGLAIIVGICVLIWMPDSPVHARMLTREERIAALERVRDGQGGTESKTLKKDQVVEALTDVRTWLIVLLTLVLASIPNGALSAFSNIIVKSFGYTTKQTLILNAPGGFIGAAMTLFVGWYSDRKKERMLPIIIALIPTIIGSALLVGLANSGNKGVLLLGSYLMGTIGPSLSLVYTYNASNTSGHTKKSTINALTLFTFSLGNVIGTEIMQSKDAPQYIPGKIAVMVMYAVGFFIPFMLRWMNVRLNKKKQAKLRDLKIQHEWSDADMQRERERHAFMDLTDKQNPFFEYMV
ncbi:MFS general substrate transporter [Gloeophyllum trabeum ATCC 11539]|uniref:MFS general substrate transporter n=1 Tax=Gloeophyllum trabeum (strain ATCC 11539 / FP-39264 / Madison 617) TaxID=670483 RepID=S7Q9K8_GLOTA|nr:MFS general substrate transporter [Gloeophyllum trabeum ATCC 11539]EPQ56202.1 MFS general substrate transporter [Gloeophyllum trabeum ATCC 11539]